MTREYHQTVYAPPPGAADILLIRHGQSAGARPGESFPMKDGHGDPELHPNGHEQAQAVARRFADAPIAAVYVTTLQRTHQTAAPLVDKLRLTPTVEADLREICLGDWDGGEYRIRAANNDPIWQRAKALREWGELPGAETTAALHERVRRGLLRIAANHPDQLVAAFVHGGVIGAAMALASGSDPFAFHGAANGSVSRLVIQGETMTIRGFNDCAHL
jgi:probable phosphoglycerate mutase